MGFFDMLEKMAAKTDEFVKKADDWLDENFPAKDERKVYTDAELLSYFKDNYQRLFYNNILANVQKTTPSVVKIHFNYVDIGSTNICPHGDIYKISIKCSGIRGIDDYGSELYHKFKCELTIFSDKYAKLSPNHISMAKIIN